MRALVSLLFALCLSLTARAQVLVEADWLRAQPAGSLHLLDARMAPQFAKGHLPGAVSADAMATLFSTAPQPVLQQRWRAWGLDQRRPIVVYDDGAGWQAPALYLALLQGGVPRARLHLLNGGLHAWAAAGGALSTLAQPPAAGDLVLGAAQPQMEASLSDFLSASGDGRSLLLDAMGPQSYYGAFAMFDRAGHVPGAVQTDSDELFGADKRFKPEAELRAQFAHLGVTPQRPVYPYCGGGGSAAAPTFALQQLLGHPQVRLFRGSLFAWASDPRALPLQTYADPSLLRTPAWVKAWGGAMLRGYGLAQVALVDVRAADEFALSHLRFAHSLPGPEWLRLRSQPQALAAALQAAGVEPALEAVVVSQGGLNDEAALAWLQLRELGQRRVSLLLPGAEQWQALGFDLSPNAKPPTPARGARTPPAPAARAASSAAPVYLVTSEARPADLPADAQVLHLPYRQLLDAQGAPLPAAAIWQRLKEAGLPRFRPVQVVADRPGAVAAGVFLLTLMGIPELRW